MMSVNESPYFKQNVEPNKEFLLGLHTTGTPAYDQDKKLKSDSEEEIYDSPLWKSYETKGEQCCCFMKGSSSRYPRSQRLKKFALAVFNVANAALGSGILAFPFAYRQTGWLLGVVLTVGCASILGWSLTVILRSARRYGCGSYQKVVGRLFGRYWQSNFQLAIAFSTFFTCVVYLIIISSQVLEFIEDAYPNSWAADSNIIVLLTAVAVTPLCMMRRMDALGPGSFLGVIAVLYVVGLVIYHGGENMDYHGNYPEIRHSCSIFQAIPIIAFAFMCHLTVIPATLGSELQPYWPSINNPGYARYRTLVYICISVIAICLMFYVPTGVFGLFCFGEFVQENILDNFGNNISWDQTPILPDSVDVKIGRLCIGVATALGYPILQFVGRSAIYDVFSLQEPVRCRTHTLITFLFIILSTGVVLILNAYNLGIGWIMGFVGSTCAVTVQFFFPGFMLYRERRRIQGSLLLLVGTLILTTGLGVTVVKMLCSSEVVSEDTCTAVGVDYGNAG